MKKLRIGQIGPLNVPIPPKKYGGTERIIDALCRGLTERGHKIFLFSANDATTKGTIIPIVPKSLWTNKIRETTPYYAYEMAIVAQKARELKLDILHDHLGPLSLSLYGTVTVPLIHTLHVPTTTARAWAYRKLKANLISISNNQRQTAPGLNYRATIYNGTDTKLFRYQPDPKNYFLFLGELAKRKGILEAIIIAKKLKVELLIAGRIPLTTPSQRDELEFFMKYVKPEFGRNQIHYVGEVSATRAAELYGNARATFFPIQWEEPFGLVMTESMSCGTPVIAFRHGSVPEIIRHGETGFIVDTLAQFEDAVRRVDNIDRRACRLHVENNFSLERMVDNYEQLYFKLLNNAKR